MAEITGTVTIGRDEVDITKPCDVVMALRKVQLRLASGGQRESVRIDGEEVVYTRANDGRLEALIKTYEAQCARASGATRNRYAKRVKFF